MHGALLVGGVDWEQVVEIADKRIVRLIQKWLAAGVLEDGTWTPSETGTVQGGSISPLLANLYLHYVFDLWVQQWRTMQAPGRVIVVRYADDFVVGFQHREDAERFLTELRDRFAKFGLELHPDKTRLLPFGPRVWKRKHDGRGPKPGTFDFLGFTHVSGRNRRGGYVLMRKTIRKRWQAKLREVRAELRRRMHDPVPEQGKYLRAVIGGHFRYYGVPGNGPRLGAFRKAVVGAWRWTLRRRGQARPLTWKRMYRFVDRWIPKVRIHHPWPSERFDVTTRGKSRMR